MNCDFFPERGGANASIIAHSGVNYVSGFLTRLRCAESDGYPNGYPPEKQRIPLITSANYSARCTATNGKEDTVEAAMAIPMASLAQAR